MKHTYMVKSKFCSARERFEAEKGVYFRCADRFTAKLALLFARVPSPRRKYIAATAMVHHSANPSA